MAEAEDVITDVARHATIYARALWRRHRPAPDKPRTIALADVAERISLLIGAIFARQYPIRIAQVPAARTFLAKMFRPNDLPLPSHAVPATDGVSLWVPADFQTGDFDVALERFRTIALQQAIRATRGSAALIDSIACPLELGLYILLEAYTSDAALIRILPGVAQPIYSLRRLALGSRPDINSIAVQYRQLERLTRTALQSPDERPPSELIECATPALSLAHARKLAAQFTHGGGSTVPWGTSALFKDYWTGDLLLPQAAAKMRSPDEKIDTPATKTRSARLIRRPQVRAALENEDDEAQGAWMIQASPPLEQAEDPMGMQRPTDRDDQTPADEFADSVSELAEARLVTSPGRPKEVLLSDDPPDGHARPQPEKTEPAATQACYPEWDYRSNTYRDPGTTVHLSHGETGSQEWIDQTLERHQSMLDMIQRRFEMLRPERTRLRKQLDGDDIDLDAYINALSDLRAGLPMPGALYQSQRPGTRNMAIMLLIDVSGSTDSWISADRRIIDIEREALLLVCIALKGMGERYSVQAFSGEGPHGVAISAIKHFDEPYDNQIALRIAALEPERYTRAGAAIRHASTLLMHEPAEHRLLLLLSDGKPNDADDYEGRYGVEDMRQAVTEAKLQGIFPFCLTIDRQAASYLPAVFGSRQYALLPKPELLPTVLLDWMRRLLSH